MDTGLIMFTIGAGLGVVALSVGVLMFDEKYEGEKKTAVSMLTSTPDSTSFLNVSIILGRDIGDSEALIAKGDCAIINDLAQNGSLELGTSSCSGSCDQIMKKAATFNKTKEIADAIAQVKTFSVGTTVKTSAFSKITNLIHVVTPDYDKTTKNEEAQIEQLSNCYANALKEAKTMKAVAMPILGLRSGFPFEKSVILAIHHAFCSPFEVYIHIADKSRFDEVRKFFMERVQDYNKIQGMTDKEKETHFKSKLWSVHFTKAMLSCVLKCSQAK